MNDLAGKSIGAYEIRRLIGHGGMADVYLAVQTAIGREVAIKVLPTYFLQDRTFLERFNREVKLIARLQHPRILPVFDFGEQDGQPYIVMAYLTGGTLADRIKISGGLPLDEAARLVGQIAEGMDFAHAQGIIHRDFKPSNVLLDEEGNVHLADFGIARAAFETAQLTGTGLSPGTPHYMAPEMSRVGAVTPLVDVYALGVTLFEMLAGRLPFDATTPVGVLLAHVSEPVPDVRKARPDLPQPVQAVIERAMAKDPAQRTPTARQMAAELQQALSAPAPAAPPLDAANIESTMPMPTPEPPTSPPLGAAGPASTLPMPDSHTPPLAAAVPAARPLTPIWVWAIGAVAVLGVGALAVLVFVVSVAVGGTAKPSGPVAASLPTSEVLPDQAANPGAPPQPTPLGGGSKIAFYSLRDDPQPTSCTTCSAEIYVMNTDGSNQTNLTRNSADDLGAAWSPDGTRIAFHSNRDGKYGIYVMNADGSGVTRLTDNPAADYAPAWSPNGTQIAFVSTRDDNQEIYVMNADGSRQTRLTTNPGSDFAPAWSPDGTRIVFTSGHDDPHPTSCSNTCNFQIYVMNADGSGLIRLTAGLMRGDSPAWSPDGKRIAFESERNHADIGACGLDCKFDIYVINADGSGLTNLTDNTLDSENPAWSPDGTHIVFMSVRDGNREIYIMNADGSGVIRLTNNSTDDLLPAWSPK
jgi:Tol biopolymer transport system component/tRNA A-37 threonylcarbamoyl transferase component Bud32